MNNKILKEHLWERIRDNRDARKENVQRILNIATKTAADKKKWPGLVIDDLELTLVAGTRIYYIPNYIDQVLQMKVSGEDDIMSEMAQPVFEEVHPDYESESQGTPEVWVDRGMKCAKAQPASAAAITIVSDSISDSGATLAIKLVGLSGGLRREELITPAGLTTATSVLSYTELFSISKVAEWTGVCTVKTGATTMAEIPPKELNSSYREILVHTTPSSAETIIYSGKRKIYDMSLDGDLPADLPDDAFAYMVLGIAEQIFTKDPELGNLTVPSAMGKDKRVNVQPSIRGLDQRAYRKKSYFGRTLGG